MERDQLLDVILVELSNWCRTVCTDENRMLNQHSPDCIAGKLGLARLPEPEEEE